MTVIHRVPKSGPAVEEAPRLDTVALLRDGDIVDTTDVLLASDRREAEIFVDEARAALVFVSVSVGEIVTAEEDAATTTKKSSMVYEEPALAEFGGRRAVTVTVMLEGP